MTGTPALSNDEMLTAFHDSTIATGLTFALTLGLLLLIVRRGPETFAHAGGADVSLAWSLGLITATVGHLSVFSVMFISLLVGIGIDYGIYIFFRYERRWRRPSCRATRLRSPRAVPGPASCSERSMAAGTFGVLILTEFRGIQEFGFIAGLSVLVAFLAMMTLFPAALLVLRRRPGPARRRQRGGDDDGGDEVPLIQ